jgi:hypothetical protein
MGSQNALEPSRYASKVRYSLSQKEQALNEHIPARLGNRQMKRGIFPRIKNYVNVFVK